MKKLFLASVLAAVASLCAQDVPSKLVVTNLNDMLHTEVKFDTASNIDVKKLDVLSYSVDMHSMSNTFIREFTFDRCRIRELATNDMFAVRSSGVGIDERYALKLHDARAIDVKPFNISEAVAKKLDISTHDIISCIAAFNRQHAVDSTQFDVDVLDAPVTEQTYNDLDDMKSMSKFEARYDECAYVAAMLRDLRRLDNQLYAKWIRVLESNEKCKISFIKNKKMRKIIGEAWILSDVYSNETRDNLRKNLAFFKLRGYDTVLLRFDCTEDINKLLTLVNDIKASGFEVFGTYVGIDYSGWNPFIDPSTISKYLEAIAPEMAGFFLNWRGMSNHARLVPEQFFNFMCNELRKHNSKILVYGEIYYGKIDPLRVVSLMTTIPENATGVVINNMGYYGYNASYIINNLFTSQVPNYKKIDKVCQVIGYRPYYCSREDCFAYLSLKSEYEYKDTVEKSFRRTGYGTVTMSHDGVDDNQTAVVQDRRSRKHYDTTDNILYDTKVQN